MANDKKIEKARTILHDLRASYSAVKLNAIAASKLSQKVKTAEGERIAKHLDFVAKDLEKVQQQLDLLTAEIKSLK